jgi:transcription elongation GreA/GreB family factor
MRATPSRLGDRGESATRFLREELGRAEIIPAGAAEVGFVTMGSVVKFLAHESNTIGRCKLVYPDEALGFSDVSILTDLGSALLGLGPGDVSPRFSSGLNASFPSL